VIMSPTRWALMSLYNDPYPSCHKEPVEDKTDELLSAPEVFP